MSVTIDSGTAMQIAELLDLFAELPSTPPILVEEARAHASRLVELMGDDSGVRTGAPQREINLPDR
ncbi:MAG TPA: hypothetical protein VML96_11400 [Egibacteraceae bacterium]|nr:hypothetical protein [Egibacteraceae bacterium]